MKVVRTLLWPLFLLAGILICTPRSAALETSATSDVVIAQVQTGGATAASQEYVSIYNNTGIDVDITGWCLFYKDSLTKPGCILPQQSDQRVFLTAHSYTTFASHEFITTWSDASFVPQAHPGFTGGMADSGGFLSLIDAAGVVRDQFTWTSKAPSGSIYQRVLATNQVLQDTGSDTADFGLTELIIPSNVGLYEQAVSADICPNLIDVQTILPSGYLLDGNGDCQQDVCINLAGLQIEVPSGYMQEGEYECILRPPESTQLVITELLPNADSYDAGREFIELYNASDSMVRLTGYRLRLGSGSTGNYVFTDGAIGPGEYRAFSDSDVGFSLPNSSSWVELLTPSGVVISSTSRYDNPKDDTAWALIEGIWQFTDRPTPGAANKESSGDHIVGGSGAASGLGACPSGKYRNPETNRCRNLESTSTLTQCGPGKYRSPETNRCRSLTVATASSSLTPCKPDQIRNPATNRCRSATASIANLKPCAEGQERNPETNRCRNVLSASSSSPQNPNEASSRRPHLFIIAAVLTAVIGYGLYEYRYDVLNFYLRLRRKQ